MTVTAGGCLKHSYMVAECFPGEGYHTVEFECICDKRIKTKVVAGKTFYKGDCTCGLHWIAEIKNP